MYMQMNRDEQFNLKNDQKLSEISKMLIDIKCINRK